VHAIGASEGGTAYEIERVNLEDEEVNPESEAQPTEPGERKEVVECPCHEPTTFVKVTSQSIISLLSILQSLS
jgi:hypothetical protein